MADELCEMLRVATFVAEFDVEVVVDTELERLGEVVAVFDKVNVGDPLLLGDGVELLDRHGELLAETLSVADRHIVTDHGVVVDNELERLGEMVTVPVTESVGDRL